MVERVLEWVEGVRLVPEVVTLVAPDLVCHQPFQRFPFRLLLAACFSR